VDWQEEYKRKLASAEEAVKIVKSGDRVAVGGSIDEPNLLTEALFARRDELRDVKMVHMCPSSDHGWCQPGNEDSFQTEILAFVGPVVRHRAHDRLVSLIPNDLHFSAKENERANERKDFDVFMVTMSSSDEQGYCCFGHELWFKKDWAAKAKKVIAEADRNRRRVCGDTKIHVSEVDYFVEYSGKQITDDELPQSVAHVEPEEKRERMIEYLRMQLPHMRPRWLGIFESLDVAGLDSLAETMAWIVPKGLEKTLETIAGHVNLLINSGDTFQIGQGMPSVFLPLLGCFDGKEDLGYHGEIMARGLATMVKEGQITGKYKTLNPNKAVVNSFVGSTAAEYDYGAANPKFEVRSAIYITDPQVIAAHDNMVAINNAVSIDLTGQMNAESLFGGLVLNGPGGQPCFQLGALMSKGGKAITVMRSAVMGGTVSTIVPQFEPGTVVTVPRHYADYIVTEYGIAKLMGKNLRERAQELISVAHPDHRAELKQEAQRLFWP